MAPGDVAVGTYEDGASFVDLPDAVPVAVGVGGAGFSDDDRSQIRKVELLGGGLPRCTAEAEEQGELPLAGDVEGGGAVAVCVDEPGVRKLGTRSCRGLEIEAGVARPLLLSGLADDGCGDVALVELSTLGVELRVLELECLVELLAEADTFGTGFLELDQSI